MKKVLALMLVCASNVPAHGSDASPWSLMNPVPNEQLRPFSADRPNRTFSTTTIDVGRFQVESDLVNLVFDRSERTRTFSLGSPVLRYGITDNAEIQLGANVFTRLKQGVTDGATGETIRGLGGSFIASKINLFGNDGGDRSMALIGTLRLPTSSRGLGAEYVEASFDLPFTTLLGSPLWRLTLQPHFSLLRNDLGTAHHTYYGAAAQLEYALSAIVTLGVEIATYIWREPILYTSSSLDVSVSWMMFENTQLDIAVHFGLDDQTPAANPYLGVSHRF